MKNSAESKNAASLDASPRAALEDAISRRARELYQLRGCVEGHALEDWLQAEAEVRSKLATQEPPSGGHPSASTEKQSTAPPASLAGRSACFNVKVGGVIYTVQYDPQRCDAYRPGMLRKGQPIELRFEEDKVYLKLPNKKELEAKIVGKNTLE